MGQGLDPDHPDPAMEREAENMAHRDVDMRFCHGAAIDSQMSIRRDLPGKTTRFRQPDEPEEFIEPHRRRRP